MKIVHFFLLAVSFLPNLSFASVECAAGKNTCSECYSLLVSQVTDYDDNFFNLQNKFFPPDKPSPLFLTIYYRFGNHSDPCNISRYDGSSEDTVEVWFWSSTVYYLFQPLHVFQYTSLLFSDLKSYASDVCLTLDPECYNASSDYMWLLTQRLKLYGTRSSFASPIDDSYDPNAASISTWKQWHEDHDIDVKFIFSYFIIFPIISWVILWFVLVYINDRAPDSRMKELRIQSEKKNDSLKYQFQNEFTLSLASVCAIFILSCIALNATIHTEEKSNSEIAKYYTCKYDKNLCLMWVLPVVLFVEDTVIFIAFWICLLVMFCLKSSSKKKNPKPLAYTELDTVFLDEELVNLSVASVKKSFKPEKEESAKSKFDLKTITLLPVYKGGWWRFCGYSIFFPICCVINHFHYIVIACIHDLSHSTSVAVVYAVAILLLYSILAKVPYIISSDRGKHLRKPHHFTKIQLIKCIVAFFVSGYMIYVILLYHFLPIDKGLEDVTSDFVTIYHTSFVFLTAIVAYFVIKHPLFNKELSVKKEASVDEASSHNAKDGVNPQGCKEEITWYDKKSMIDEETAEVDTTAEAVENAEVDSKIKMTYAACGQSEAGKATVFIKFKNITSSMHPQLVKVDFKWRLLEPVDEAATAPGRVEESSKNDGKFYTILPHKTTKKCELDLNDITKYSTIHLQWDLCYTVRDTCKKGDSKDVSESGQFELPYSFFIYRSPCTQKEFYSIFQCTSNKLKNFVKFGLQSKQDFSDGVKSLSSALNVTVVEETINFATFYGKSIIDSNGVCILMYMVPDYVNLIIEVKASNEDIFPRVKKEFTKLFKKLSGPVKLKYED